MASNAYSCLTTKWRIKNAQNFANNIIDQTDVLYLFIGRNKAWDDDENPPIANDSVQTTEYDHWRDMLSAKRVDGNDVRLCVPRYNWESGKIFDMYRDEEDAFDDDTGAWKYTGTLNISRSKLSGVGSLEDSLAIAGWSYSGQNNLNIVERFQNEVWSTDSTISTNRSNHESVGTSISALVFGGNIGSSFNSTRTNTTEEYDGSSWSAGGNLNAARSLLGSAGTATAALAISGQGDSGVNLTSVEEYDGTTWSIGTSLNTHRRAFGSGGYQDDCVVFGGFDTSPGVDVKITEEFDGVAWSTGGNLLNARSYLGGTASDRNHALSFGGVKDDTAFMAITEEYDGTIWITKQSLNTKRMEMGSSGVPSGSLAFGGRRVLQDLAVTESFDKNITGVYGLIFKEFYVLTDEDKVYKCLWNNNGNPSTVKPTDTGTTEVTLADGYIWKYMYTLTTAEKLKYLTSKYMPVKTLNVDNGSLQWQVQDNAANGGIHVIEMVSHGDNYDPHSGTVKGVTSSTQIVLDSTGTYLPSSLDNRYVDSDFYIDSGTGAGQLRKVSAYDGTTKTVTLDVGLSPLPVVDDSTYQIAPRVIIGGDGTSANAISNVVSNSIIGVTVTNIGQDYTQKLDFDGTSIISFSANGGSGASAVPIISPRNGHGSDPEDELFGFNICIYRNLDGSESNNFTVVNDYRKYGLLLNPLQYNSTNAFTDTHAQQTLNLTIANSSTDFVKDGWVTGSTSGANGIIVDWNQTSNNILRLTEIRGTFQNSEGITQATSSTVITGTISNIDNPDMKKYSGDIIFSCNREPVERNASSSEEFNVIVIY